MFHLVSDAPLLISKSDFGECMINSFVFETIRNRTAKHLILLMLVYVGVNIDANVGKKTKSKFRPEVVVVTVSFCPRVCLLPKKPQVMTMI